MTPVSVPSSLCTGTRAALARELDRAGVVQAAIVGSYARGEQRATSDLDVALWVEPSLTAQAGLDLCSTLLRDAQQAIGDRARIDLVDLRRASPTVRHRAIRDADVLVERDHVARVRLDRDSLIEYWDTAPLRELQRRALQQRVQEDRFGRP